MNTPNDIPERVRRVQLALDSLQGSLPYWAPEVVAYRYYHSVAAIMNILDPEGTVISEGREHARRDNSVTTTHSANCQTC